MAQAIAATVPHETAARKLAEWLAKLVHRVQVVKTGDQWSIFVPEAALHRARRALSEVMVAANPGKGRECCQKLGQGAACARCGKHAHFTVGWIIPRRTPDERPACSSACAAALLRQPARNAAKGAGDWYVRELAFDEHRRLCSIRRDGPFRTEKEALAHGRAKTNYPWTVRRGAQKIVVERKALKNPGGNDKRYNVWAYNRLTGGSFELERNVDAKTAVRAYREARKQGLRPWCIDLTTRNEVHPTRSGAFPNPVNKRARRAQRRLEQRVREDLGLSGRPLARRSTWTGGKDAYNEGRRVGSGFVRFWMWNDREWVVNMRANYQGDGDYSLREMAAYDADEQAAKRKIDLKSAMGERWRQGFIQGYEAAIAAAFGPRRASAVDENPSVRSAWEKMTGRQRMYALMAAGIDHEVAEMKANRPWEMLPTIWRGLLEKGWHDTSGRGTTRRMVRATTNPSKKVREARVAKVKMLLVRIKAILQAGEQHLRMGRRQQALESSRRADALWDQMPKGVAMVSPHTRREAYELSQRGVRLRNGQVLFNGRRVRRNAAGQYLIQAIRPKHRNWVTIDVKDDLNRALLNALQRARLGNVTYRVWDTETVSEVWRGSGKDATIEGWKTARPSGLVGANRRRRHAP